MNIRRAVAIFAVGLMTASCSDTSVPERGGDSKTSESPREPEQISPAQSKAALAPPSEGKIGRDCVAFVRSTKVVSAGAPRADCPGCPVGGAEVLSVRQLKTDAVSCSGDTCNVVVTVRAVFNPGEGESIAGGLTPWIPPEQRSAYLSGQTPAEEQVYRVHITYKDRGEGWQAAEFDRAPAE